MNLADIPAGSAVFLDANIFVYYFAPDPQFGLACRALLERVSRNEIAGFTSSHVLCDVAHRLMTYEAAAKYGWAMTGIAYRLQRQPAELSALIQFRQAVDEIPNFGLQVLSVDLPHVLSAAVLVKVPGCSSPPVLRTMPAHDTDSSTSSRRSDHFSPMPCASAASTARQLAENCDVVVLPISPS